SPAVLLENPDPPTPPKTSFQVDVKVDDARLVSAVLNLAARHPGRSSRLLWGSFRQRTASRCLTSAPHVPLFASFQRALVMLAAYKLGLLRHLHIYESALVIPWRLHLANFSILGPFFQALFCGPGMTPSGPGSPGGLGGICTRGGLQLTYYFTDPGWFAELNRRGVAVVLFGCLNDERRFEICR
ncbi:hypothetical protein Vretimale_7530, partial [Volvox reticuliferus]